MRAAFIEGDASTLSEHIDFEALRSNLTRRLASSYQAPVQQSQSGSMYNLATILLAGQLETGLTPEGLHQLVNRVDAGGVERSVEERHESFKHSAWHTYQSPSRFSTLMTFDGGIQVRLTLGREGLSWRLRDIEFLDKGATSS